MKLPKNCPHCHRGTLQDDHGKGLGWSYSCKGKDACGRVWFVLDDKYWLACFDAGGAIYEIKDGKVVQRIPDYKPLWKQLWDKVRE